MQRSLRWLDSLSSPWRCRRARLAQYRGRLRALVGRLVRDDTKVSGTADDSIACECAFGPCLQAAHRLGSDEVTCVEVTWLLHGLVRPCHCSCRPRRSVRDTAISWTLGDSPRESSVMCSLGMQVWWRRIGVPCEAYTDADHHALYVLLVMVVQTWMKPRRGHPGSSLKCFRRSRVVSILRHSRPNGYDQDVCVQYLSLSSVHVVGSLRMAADSASSVDRVDSGDAARRRRKHDGHEHHD